MIGPALPPGLIVPEESAAPVDEQDESFSDSDEPSEAEASSSESSDDEHSVGVLERVAVQEEKVVCCLTIQR